MSLDLTTIRSEKCVCDHYRYQHLDATFAMGHGPCAYLSAFGPKCQCAKFTWDGKSGPFAVA